MAGCSSRSDSQSTEAAAGCESVGVPSWRLDCDREIDVIEEVARMWGYRRIERTVPPGVPGGSGGLTGRQRESGELRDILAGAGYDEAWTTTFLAPGDLERAGLDPAAVEVENPLDRSESILRTELLPGLLKAVKFNVDRQADDVALFEIGHVFGLPRPARTSLRTRPNGWRSSWRRPAVRAGRRERDSGRSEAGAVGGCGRGGAAAAAAARTWGYLADALRLQAPSRWPRPGCRACTRPAGARVAGAEGQSLGAVGEVDPEVVEAYGLRQRVGYLTVSVDALLAEPRPLAGPRGEPVPGQRHRPGLRGRRLRAGRVGPGHPGAGRRRPAGGGLAVRRLPQRPRSGPGRRSLAFRLRFRAQDHTLDDSELADIRQRAIDAVGAAYGAELRA